MEENAESPKSRALLLPGMLILLHGLGSAWMGMGARGVTADTMAGQLGQTIQVVWTLIGVLEAGLGLMVVLNISVYLAYVFLVVLGVISGCTLALGNAALQIGLAIWVWCADPARGSGLKL
jgi:hypothetical protein